MSELDVDEAALRLAKLWKSILGASMERRPRRPEGAPTRLQEFALLAIGERGGMPVADVAELLEISAPSTSQLLSAMEEKGWLERRILPEDRRRHEVTLTDAGMHIVAGMAARRRARWVEVLERLSPEERGQLVSIVQRLVESGAASGDLP